MLYGRFSLTLSLTPQKKEQRKDGCAHCPNDGKNKIRRHDRFGGCRGSISRNCRRKTCVRTRMFTLRATLSRGLADTTGSGVVRSQFTLDCVGLRYNSIQNDCWVAVHSIRLMKQRSTDPVRQKTMLESLCRRQVFRPFRACLATCPILSRENVRYLAQRMCSCSQTTTGTLLCAERSLANSARFAPRFRAFLYISGDLLALSCRFGPVSRYLMC